MVICGLDPTLEIVLLEVGAVLPVPLGAFCGVPLPLAFIGATSFLPVAQSRIGRKPLAADTAGPLPGSSLLFHRFLRLVMWKTMEDFI